MKMRIRAVLILTLIFAASSALTGCSGSAPATLIPSPDALQPSSPPSLGALLLQPAVQLSSSQAAGLTSMPWRLTAVSDDRRSIEVMFVAGDGYCTKAVGFRLESGDSSITVKALSRENGDSSCPTSLALGHVTLTLPKALATGVKLLHAPVARSWDNPNFFG